MIEDHKHDPYRNHLIEFELAVITVLLLVIIHELKEEEEEEI
ncbi:hypothetical protein JCM17380_18390 [Desulfosporosinus burensis]